MADTKLGIRRFLNDQGYNDNDITYDNGSVKLKGRNFTYATPEADGSTYGTEAGLRNALNNYKTTGLMDNITNRVNAAPPKFEAPKPFTYDPTSDIQYQNALKSAAANAQTAGNNAMVALGSRGIGNSSITSDRVAQIGNAEMGKVTRDVLPQLISQAYTRYLNDNTAQRQAMMDNYNVGQDQLKNFNGLLDTTNKLGQQEIKNANDAEDRAYAIQDIRINRAKDLESRYGVQVKPTEEYSQSLAQVEGLKPISQQNAERAADKARKDEAWALVESLGYVPPQAADVLGVPVGTPTMKAKEFAHRVSNDNAQIGISQQNANTSAKNAETSAKNAETSASKVPAQKPPSKNEVQATYVSNIDQMTPENRKQFFSKEKANIIAELGQTGYQQLYGMYFDKYGDPIE